MSLAFPFIMERIPDAIPWTYPAIYLGVTFSTSGGEGNAQITHSKKQTNVKTVGLFMVSIGLGKLF